MDQAILKRSAGLTARGISLVAVALLAASGCKPPSSGPADSRASGAVVATLNGNPITLQELDAFASPTNREAYQGLYDARRGALEQLINERLIESAAAQEGVTSDEFFERKIEAHVAPVTGAEVRTFYDANFKPGEGREFEDVAGRIEAFLLRNRVVERRDEILAGLSAKAKLEISLDPPRADVPVSPTEPAIGPVTAAVTIVEYSDFQ